MNRTENPRFKANLAKFEAEFPVSQEIITRCEKIKRRQQYLQKLEALSKDQRRQYFRMREALKEENERKEIQRMLRIIRQKPSPPVGPLSGGLNTAFSEKRQ